LLASGLCCPAYLFPGFDRYGIDEGVDNSSKVIEQIRIPGYRATGIIPKFDNSRVARPLQPGSNNPAVP
jgi:hypothetical protein